MAKKARGINGILVGVDREYNPCELASAVLHAEELAGMGSLRVKSKPLAVLMLLYRVRQISELLELQGKARILIGVGMSRRVFKDTVKDLAGGEWTGVECSVECRAEDLTGVASFSAQLL